VYVFAIQKETYKERVPNVIIRELRNKKGKKKVVKVGVRLPQRYPPELYWGLTASHVAAAFLTNVLYEFFVSLFLFLIAKNDTKNNICIVYRYASGTSLELLLICGSEATENFDLVLDTDLISGYIIVLFCSTWTLICLDSNMDSDSNSDFDTDSVSDMDS
jgi:hypothetical protein